MIQASTTARASASTARTEESQTVVQRMRQTSGSAMTANEARMDSTVMAPGRPGGASLNPATSAVTTGVTVSTATTISRSVGSQAHAAIRGHAIPRGRRTPVATATSAPPVRQPEPEGRPGYAGASPGAGGLGGPFRGPPSQ